MTRQRYNPVWLALAFFALLATNLPALVWACPMSPPAAGALMACESNATSQHACCKNHGSGKCCKPMPQAPTDDSRQNNGQTFCKVSTAVEQGVVVHSLQISSAVLPRLAATQLQPRGTAPSRAADVSLPYSHAVYLDKPGRAPPLS